MMIHSWEQYQELLQYHWKRFFQFHTELTMEEMVEQYNNQVPAKDAAENIEKARDAKRGFVH